MNSQKLVVSPYDLADLVLIKAVTNLHPGVGRTGEIIDLPVQEDNLGFPIIYSSSLKGALKSAFWHLNKDLARALFGPEPEEEGEKFTSAIAIPDAFVVAFPVRSLEGVYAFATSPLLLYRFSEYARIVDINFNYVNELSKLSVNDGKCYASLKAGETLKLNVEGMKDRLLINEEINVELSTNKNKEIEELEKLFEIEEGRLVLLSNNDALRAMERSLVRVTRIAVDREKKTVKRGALWTEEYVPWDTVFVSTFLYSKAKSEKEKELQENASAVKEKFRELLGRLRHYLIIGGNETVGRGIIKLKPIDQNRRE
jgi:CRISPR-associated protein Cmr4